MGDPIARLVTPWLQALTERCGSAPLDLFSHLPPDCASRVEFQESGLYLFPNALTGQFADKLTDNLKPILQDIKCIDGSNRSKVATYQSFQGVSSIRCSCKYNYEGASKQRLYHRGSTNHLQPASLTKFLDDIFDAFEEWGDGEYSMIDQCCDSTLGQDASERQKPRNFNLVVVNEYNFVTEPRSQIPWHDDAMGQSARNPRDLLVTPVISISLGDSAIFSVMPNNKKSPQFVTDMCSIDGWASKNDLKWNNARLRVRGRFAFYLHHGDILLMTGKFQQHFIHKTWHRNPQFQDPHVLGEYCRSKNYSFLRIDNDDQRARYDLGTRFEITGRHIHYHEDPRCQLRVLPPDQHGPPAWNPLIGLCLDVESQTLKKKGDSTRNVSIELVPARDEDADGGADLSDGDLPGSHDRYAFVVRPSHDHRQRQGHRGMQGDSDFQALQTNFTATNTAMTRHQQTQQREQQVSTSDQSTTPGPGATSTIVTSADTRSKQFNSASAVTGFQYKKHIENFTYQIFVGILFRFYSVALHYCIVE